jgi:hypothetical protein
MESVRKKLSARKKKRRNLRTSLVIVDAGESIKWNERGCSAGLDGSMVQPPTAEGTVAGGVGTKGNSNEAKPTFDICDPFNDVTDPPESNSAPKTVCNGEG